MADGSIGIANLQRAASPSSQGAGRRRGGHVRRPRALLASRWEQLGWCAGAAPTLQQGCGWGVRAAQRKAVNTQEKTMPHIARVRSPAGSVVKLLAEHAWGHVQPSWPKCRCTRKALTIQRECRLRLSCAAVLHVDDARAPPTGGVTAGAGQAQEKAWRGQQGPAVRAWWQGGQAAGRPCPNVCRHEEAVFCRQHAEHGHKPAVQMRHLARQPARQPPAG